MNAEDGRPHVDEGGEAAGEPESLREERSIAGPQSELPGGEASDLEQADDAPSADSKEGTDDTTASPSQDELSGILSTLPKVTNGKSHDDDPREPGKVQAVSDPGAPPAEREEHAFSLPSGDRILSFASGLSNINLSQVTDLFGIYQSEARARFQQQQTARELTLKTERQKVELRLQQEKFNSELAKLKADIEHQQELRRLEIRKESTGEVARSVVLLLVVLAVVLTPLLAMGWFHVKADSFSEYVAPITGITGTVLGYWFGRQEPKK